jgi:hypothetical protein
MNDATKTVKKIRRPLRPSTAPIGSVALLLMKGDRMPFERGIAGWSGTGEFVRLVFPGDGHLGGAWFTANDYSLIEIRGKARA